jgi:hypothetical protein
LVGAIRAHESTGRSTAALKINYIWPQNDNDSSTKSSLLLDDMVVAKQRIGCTVKK